MLYAAVIMPQPWRGGMLNYGIFFCNLLNRMTFRGQKMSVVFAVPTGYDKSLIQMLDADISVIEATQEVDSESTAGNSPSEEAGSTIVTNQATFEDPDGHLLSADFWIVMTAFTHVGPLSMRKPYAVYAPDFIQRYVPEIFPREIHPAWIWSANQNVSLQRARCVFATTPKTAADARCYAGVRHHRIVQFPIVHFPLFKANATLSPEQKQHRYRTLLTLRSALRRVDQITRLFRRFKPQFEGNARFRHEPSMLNAPYFLWVTNSTQHKNHLRGIEALRRYYEGGGTMSCYVCGPFTHLLAPDHADPTYAYCREVGESFARLPEYGNRIQIVGELPNDLYQQYLNLAGFIWHNVLADNGTFAVVDAAIMGTRSVVSDYPQMRYTADYFGLEPMYFDAYDPADATRSLHRMEAELKVGRTKTSITTPSDTDLLAEMQMTEIITKVMSQNDEL